MVTSLPLYLSGTGKRPAYGRTVLDHARACVSALACQDTEEFVSEFAHLVVADMSQPAIRSWTNITTAMMQTYMTVHPGKAIPVAWAEHKDLSKDVLLRPLMEAAVDAAGYGCAGSLTAVIERAGALPQGTMHLSMSLINTLRKLAGILGSDVSYDEGWYLLGPQLGDPVTQQIACRIVPLIWYGRTQRNELLADGVRQLNSQEVAHAAMALAVVEAEYHDMDRRLVAYVPTADGRSEMIDPYSVDLSDVELDPSDPEDCAELVRRSAARGRRIARAVAINTPESAVEVELLRSPVSEAEMRAMLVHSCNVLGFLMSAEVRGDLAGRG